MATSKLNPDAGMALEVRGKLNATKGQSAKQLGKILKMQTPSVSSILSALYYAGYVNRTKTGMEYYYTVSKKRTPRPHTNRRSSNKTSDNETLIDLNSLTNMLKQHETYKATLDLIIDLLEEIGMCKRS